jgi:hypothetical protein
MGTDPRTGCALLRPWPQRRAPTQGPDARCLRAAAAQRAPTQEPDACCYDRGRSDGHRPKDRMRAA